MSPRSLCSLTPYALRRMLVVFLINEWATLKKFREYNDLSTGNRNPMSCNEQTYLDVLY
jgi:hypothetical protein